MSMNLSITKKQVLLFVAFGLLPAVVIGGFAISGTSAFRGVQGARLSEHAATLGDMIDRNLFERYGDVQAFGLNTAVLDQSTWYQPESALVTTMNRLADTYDIYALMQIVDLEGKVIAVNSRDGAGKAIDTRALYGKNYRSAPWFAAVSSGRYTTSTPFSAASNGALTGTYVEDVHVDEDIAALYGSSAPRVLGFVAPIKDLEGKVVAYWRNCATFDAIEDIVEEEAEDLAERGYTGAHVVLVNGATQQVIMAIDAAKKEVTDPAITESSAVQRVLKGEAAFELVEDSEGADLAGFAPLNGALGFAGMQWGVVVQVPESEILVAANAIRRNVFLSGLACLALIIVAGVFIGRKIARPITEMAAVAERVSAGDLDHAITYKGQDEIGQLARSLTTITTTLKGFSTEFEALIQHARLGNLARRADASAYQGSYRDIMEGTNSILEAFVQPIEGLRNVLARAADGDLQGRMDGDYAGEYAALQNAWNRTSEALTDVLQDAHRSSVQVNQRSDQIRQSAKGLADGAAEQAATLEEISAQMEQVAMQTRGNAGSAGRASELAMKARDDASRGDSAMSQMVEAMKAIEGSSRDISRIIKVIDDIAFQTNLLALNAAVEAARAGEHGKGFAVVAEEVRNLAARSARAAQETTDMIGASIGKVELGTKIARDTAEALDGIVQSVNQVSEHVRQIATASNDQAEGISQINEGLSQVNQIIQQNTATSEENSAAAQELSSQAERLASALSRFELGADSETPAPMREVRASRPKTGTRARPLAKPAPAAPARPAAGANGSGNGKAGKPVIALDDSDFGKF